ncbi:MAG: type II secretion system secretin GspD [Rhodospirillales bacterium]|nr:type II secretion system secretin GspD [Rhodospirillales bacterium]
MTRLLGAIAGMLAIPLLMVALGACESRKSSGGPPISSVGSATKEHATGAPLSLASEALAQSAGTAPVLAKAEIYRGKVAPTPEPRTGPAFAIGDGGEVTLNFVNADIREAIDTILGDILGVTYVVDPRVTGTITIRSTKPIPQEALIATLENVLASNGAALVPSDGGYKIQPLDVAATGFPPAQFDAAAGAFGIHVLPLRFASAVNLQETLQPLVPPGRVLRVDPVRNLLIFSGTGGEAAELQNLVDIFDVDWMAGRSFGLFPVEFANPRVMAQELASVFGPVQSAATPGAPAPNTGAIRFLPIERLRAVLAIAGDVSLIEEVRLWVERLDRGQEGDGRRIYVYRVQNGRAADLGRVLGQLFPATVTPVGREGPRPSLAPGLIPTEIGFEAVPVPESALGDGATAGVVGLEEGAQQYPDIVPTLAAAVVEERRPGIQIVPDVRNNALVISATPEEYRQIEGALRQLDVTPLQVLIEATIAEVTLTDELRYGLQWFFHTGDSNFTFSSVDDGTVAPFFPGFNYVLSAANAQVVLNALTDITDVKVISSPQLMVLNNETARLQVGDQVPIATQEQQFVSDSDAPIVNSIEYRDTGVILSVSPRVNAGGLVVLDIIQEVSDVVETTTSELNSPTIQQRQVKSTVAVQSGESVALGGLIRDGNSKGVTGIPLLSEIPLFGHLFKTTSDVQRRTELLILLTPRVVANRQDARDITEELRNRVRALAPLEYRIQ